METWRSAQLAVHRAAGSSRAAFRKLSTLPTIEAVCSSAHQLLVLHGFAPKPKEGSNPIFNVALLIVHKGQLYRADSGDFLPERIIGKGAMWAIGCEWAGAVMTYRALIAEGVAPGRALRRTMTEAARMSVNVGGRQTWFNMPARPKR